MSKGFYTKKLLLWIFVVLLLLSVCISVDYATNNDTISNINQSEMDIANCSDANCTVINGVHYDNLIVKSNESGIARLQNVVVTKPKYPIIVMTGKPSCTKCARNHIPYRWFTRSYINYCPNCHHYGTLGNKHKWQSRYEQEISCFRCDSDFDIYCGKEKYSWSNVYLRRA